MKSQSQPSMDIDTFKREVLGINPIGKTTSGLIDRSNGAHGRRPGAPTDSERRAKRKAQRKARRGSR